jgi:hypothetical protein
MPPKGHQARSEAGQYGTIIRPSRLRPATLLIKFISPAVRWLAGGGTTPITATTSAAVDHDHDPHAWLAKLTRCIR